MLFVAVVTIALTGCESHASQGRALQKEYDRLEANSTERTARRRVSESSIPQLSPKCVDEDKQDADDALETAFRHERAKSSPQNERERHETSSISTRHHCSLRHASRAHAQFGSGIVYDPTQSAHAAATDSAGKPALYHHCSDHARMLSPHTTLRSRWPVFRSLFTRPM